MPTDDEVAIPLLIILSLFLLVLMLPPLAGWWHRRKVRRRRAARIRPRILRREPSPVQPVWADSLEEVLSRLGGHTW